MNRVEIYRFCRIFLYKFKNVCYLGRGNRKQTNEIYKDYESNVAQS